MIELGDGKLKTDPEGYVDVADIGIKSESPKSLSEQVYPNLEKNFKNPEWLTERAILSPTNASVNDINIDLLKHLPGMN